MKKTKMTTPCFLTLITIFFNSCSLLDCYVVREGISNYDPADSSMSLCNYLTVRDDGNTRFDETLFVDKYKWNGAYYKYVCDNNHNKSNQEYVLLVLKYASDEYSLAKDDVLGQEGYCIDAFSFYYKTYLFCLNNTDACLNHPPFTEYEILEDKIRIRWINLVGYSDKLDSLAFIGLYCHQYGETTDTYYMCNSWDKMFEDYFDYCFC